MKKILVCGGRDYWDRNKVYSTLDEYTAELGRVHIICGGAKGADQLAFDWAQKSEHICTCVFPEWTPCGKSAGPKRNQEMIDMFAPDFAIAFPGGPGTMDMVAKLGVAEIRTILI